jgi:hypothetical protein
MAATPGRTEEPPLPTPARTASTTRLACAAALLLAGCQQPKPPQVDLDALHADPPASGTGSCPVLASDWLSLLPAQQRRNEPAHCSQHGGTPLFAWGEPRDRQTGSAYAFSLRQAGGAVLQSRSGLAEPRLRLAQSLPAGDYEWAVSYTAATGSAQTTQWRRFSLSAPDGQARPHDLIDGSLLAAQVAARARPRMLAAGSSFDTLRSAAQQAEHLPALTLLRKRANAALNASLPAAPAAPALGANALAQAQSLAALVQTARSERLQLEALATLARLDGNASQLAAAKRRLLALAAWPAAGSTSEAGASEANRELTLALAQGLDLLWNDLSSSERSQVSAPLRERLMQTSKALALLDREPFHGPSLLNLRAHTQALLLAAGLPGFPEAQTLLASAWELHRHSLQTWGYDGNLGPAIAQGWEQFASATELAAAVRTVAAVNLYSLSVQRRSAEQLIAFTPAGQPQGPAFGDGTEARDPYERHSAALRLHAQQGRDLAAIWYWQARAGNVGSPTDASIWQLLLLGVDRNPLPTGSATLANDWFSSQAGLAALHNDVRRPDRSSVYFRSSRFGSYGAAQAEQNALVYVSQGQPLLVNAGSTPFPGSPHHRSTRAARYKNTLSVDGGLGQAEPNAGATRPGDPLATMDAGGALIRTQSSGNYAAVSGDASAAYRAVDSARNAWTPLLTNAVRSVVMDKANGLTFVYDWASSAQPRQWELNWHAPNAFVADAATVRASNGGASVCIDRHGPATQFSQTSAWDVPPETAQAPTAHGRFSTLARSAEFAHLSVLREGCRSASLQVQQNGTQISVLVNGRDTLQFDRRALSLPSATAAAPTVSIAALPVNEAAAAGSTPGGSTTPAAAATASSPVATADPVTEPAVAIVPSSQIARLDPLISDFRQQTWSAINCHNTYGSFAAYANSGLHGSKLPDGRTQRFGPIADPLNPSRRVYELRVHQNDPLTAGAKRCELIALPNATTAIPYRENVWFGVSLRVVDGRLTRGEDRLLFQWHASGFNPFLALLLKDGKLRIETRHNNNANASAKTSTLSTPWRDPLEAPSGWMDFVVQARVSPDAADRPFVRVWRDGKLLFEQQGPLGYRTTELSSARVGYYQWLSLNSWDASQPVRSMHISKALLVRDPAQAYNMGSIRSALR